MLMVDFFSGLKGASQYPKDLGWEVITIDIEPNFNPTYVLDINDLLPTELYDLDIDLCWFSPPCTEFSKDSMPWHDANVDLSLVFRSIHIAKILKPKFWLLENVRGLQRYLGRSNFHLGPFYFWGCIPG